MRPISNVILWLPPVTVALFLGAPVLSAQGWQDLPNTQLQSVCPPNNFQPAGGGMPAYDFANNCHNVIDGNSSAALDTKRNRLIIWGGGHAAYPGNEVYALELGTLSSTYKARTNSTAPSMVRLTDPSVYSTTCSGNSDGTPQSTHTYQSLIYLPRQDKMFKWGGANYCGAASPDDANVWLFNAATNAWEHPTMTWVGGAQPGTATDGTRCVLDTTKATDSVVCYYSYRQMWRFDFPANTATLLTAWGYDIQSKPSLVLDPDRRMLFAFGYGDNITPSGGKVFSIALDSPYTKTEITAGVTGCADLAHYWYPSVVWDPSLHRIVGYVPRTASSQSANNEIFIFDPATYTCVQQPLPGGPAASGAHLIDADQGTYDRFTYNPVLGKYLLVNNAALDAYTFTLNPNQSPGLGATTTTCIDRDGDGYGTGPGCTGPDADDQDAAVHTGAQAVAKWGTLAAFLQHLGYNPAHIWYVSAATNSPAGNDSTGSVNDAAHPFATCCGKGKANPVAGDAVLFRGGNYTFSTSFPSGTVGAPTILMSYPGEQAQFTTYPSGFVLLNTAWTIVDGFLFHANGGTACVSAGSNNNIVFRHIDASGCMWGMVASGDVAPYQVLADFTVEDSLFHDNAGNGSGQHGIYLASHGGAVSKNVFVRRNLLYKNDYTGMQFNGKVTNLIQEQNITYSNNLSGFAWEEGVSNSINRNNISLNDTKGGLNISTYDGYDGNTSIASCGAGFNELCSCSPVNRGSICPYDQTGNLVMNNTIYMTGLDWTGGGPCTGSVNDCRNGIEVGRQGGCTTAMCRASNNGGNTFRNIIVKINNKSTDFAPFKFGDTTTPKAITTTTFDGIRVYNKGYAGVVYAGTATYACPDLVGVAASVTNCANADPKFVAADPSYWATPASFNLRLQASSPAIGTGTAVPYAGYDLIGTPHSTAPTLGAYEFSGAPATGTAPSCDVNGDGVIDSQDVQAAIAQALGVNACGTADLQQNGQCSVIDVQRVVAAVLGGACVVGK